MNDIEYHPLEPFLPKNAQLLMLGSFPPQEIRWSMRFYYPNLQNDMWRIFGLLFFNDRDKFIDKANKRFNETALRTFLAERGIALCDTARAVRRQKGNASDQFLEIVEPINVAALLHRLPHCHTIVTTGEKATDTLCPLIHAHKPAVGTYAEGVCDGRDIRLYRMPSSSRAYPKPIEAKAATYRTVFEYLGWL